MILRIALLAAAILLISTTSRADMTPEEQMLSVALQGEESAISAMSAGTTVVRSAIETLIHKKDEQINGLKEQIAKRDEQIKDLQAQLAKWTPNVEVKSK